MVDGHDHIQPFCLEGLDQRQEIPALHSQAHIGVGGSKALNEFRKKAGYVPAGGTPPRPPSSLGIVGLARLLHRSGERLPAAGEIIIKQDPRRRQAGLFAGTVKQGKAEFGLQGGNLPADGRL